MSQIQFKAGDWVVFDLKVGQLKEVGTCDSGEFSDGFICCHGRILDRCRELTLRNKATVEAFEIYYQRLREIDGEAGFNWPRIHDHFAQMALKAIDDPEHATNVHDMALEFVKEARNYTLVIQGVPLFKPRIR